MLERMLEERAEIVLLRTTSPKYGMVVEARERYRGETCMRGFVSRVDLPVVLQIMEMQGEGVIVARVMNVSTKGSYFCVDIDVPEGFVQRTDIEDNGWDKWHWDKSPIMDMTDDMVRADEAFTLLETALQHAGMFDDEYIIENLDQLITATRYDVSREAQHALVWCRRMVGSYPSFAVQDYGDILVHAINGLGSRNRREEFDDVYFNMLCDSEQTRQMLQTWYEGMGMRKPDEESLQSMMIAMIDDISTALHSLPCGLGSDALDFGMLMHRLVYKHVSRKRLLEVLSATVMRSYLINELEIVIDGTQTLIEEDIDVEEDGIVMQLKPIFWGDAEEASSFARRARGLRNVQITSMVREMIADNRISQISAHRTLWRILHDAGIYKAGESNWNKSIR